MKAGHLLLATLFLAGCATAPRENGVVRMAVVGDMIKTGLWPALANRFESESGYRVKVVVFGNRDLLTAALRSGKADIITIQSGDAATDLVTTGYALNMRAWARTEYVIVGPRTDPAGIRGLHDGAVALRRLSASRTPFVHFQNSANREITSRLWIKAAVEPGDWLLEEESQTPVDALISAYLKRAYVVLARLPTDSALFSADGMEILVQGDPEMNINFVVIEADSKKFPTADAKGARALSDFLLAEKTQNFLLTFGTNNSSRSAQFQSVNQH